MPGSWQQSLAEHRSDLAYTDDLTGLFNHRLLNRFFEDLWPALRRQFAQVSVMMIDLDNFKEVNDTCGHLVGDEVLRATARILRTHFRDQDIIVRYGGDEFVVILPGAGEAEAGKLGERARQALGRHPFTGTEPPITVPVSFSIGIASAPVEGDTGEQLLALADARLFEDKRQRHQLLGLPRNLPRRTVVLLITLVLVAAVAALTLVIRRHPAPPPAPRPEAGSEREAELIAQIEALQQQLATLTERTRLEPTTDRPENQRRIDDLQARISELEGRLEAPRPTPALPRPTATPTVTTVQALAATPVPATPTLPPSPTPTATPTPPEPAEPVIVTPALIRHDRPPYPPMAARMHREATVTLKVTVSPEGNVLDAQADGPPAGYGFDQAARQAALSARYRPGTRDGVPTTMQTTLVIRFHLGDQE